MTKFLEISEGGYVWHVPVHNIADNRSKYYAEKDPDTTYQEEYDYLMGDDSEVVDWYSNNMDFEDIEAFAVLVHVPPPLKKPSTNPVLDVVDFDAPLPPAA